MKWRIGFLPLMAVLLTGCVVPVPHAIKPMSTPFLSDNLFQTEDGIHLPLRHWLPKTEPKAVIIALHGFNDYGRFFAKPGAFFSASGVACFAYDQRGFGEAPRRGQWAGTQAYINDVGTLVKLLRQRYPRQPIYLLGESMGGAVIVSAVAQSSFPVDGVILAAPALWARETMPWYQTSLLWTLNLTMPWLRLTGEGIDVTPSDNIAMLRELGRDLWVIKKTRVDAMNGLTDLMDDAYANADKLPARTLLLYGEKDDIIPKKPTYDFIQRLLKNGENGKTVALYRDGYHMLLRDLKADIAWRDILAWIAKDIDKLPSGADHYAGKILQDMM